jgi:hypothetical protein
MRGLAGGSEFGSEFNVPRLAVIGASGSGTRTSNSRFTMTSLPYAVVPEQ